MIIYRKPAGLLIEIAHRIFPMHRVHLGLLSTRPSPVTYMYVVSAKIPCLSANLSPTHSYCQHSHFSISETRGVVDGDRSSYFPHASSASGAPSNTTKPGHPYVRCGWEDTFFPSKLSPTHSFYQDGHDDISETRGVVDRDRSSYFPHASSASGAPSNTTKPGHLYVRCECKNALFALKIVSYS